MGINLGLTRGSVVLTQGGAGAWDELKPGPLCILKMGASDYRMWYEGIDDPFIGDTPTKIGYATSTDGTSWTKYGGNPIFAATQTWQHDEVSVGTVLYDEGTFKLWGHGGNNSGPRQIFYATSSDGLTWTLGNSNNPIVAPGTAGAWDESSVADACVIKMGPTDYRMWYVGKNASSVQAVGYATSSDGISWSKSGSNPVFQSGTAGQWDDNLVYGLRVVKRGCDRTGFHAWYAADDGSVTNEGSGIGYAWSADGITWVRGKNNPVLAGRTGPDEMISDPVFVMEDPINQTMRVYFYYDDFSVSPAERSHEEATVDLKPSILTQVESVRTGTTDPHTFNVTPQGLPCGIVVTGIHGTSATDHMSTVTYGGVSLSRVVTAQDTATEPGRADIWWLGDGIPTGTQTVSIDLTSATTDDFQFCCYVLYANGNMDVIASGIQENDVANPSIALSYRGRMGIGFGALYGGGAAPSSFTPNGSTTALETEDLGAFYAYTMVQTTPGTSDYTVGGTAVSDDVAFAAAAFGPRVSQPTTERLRRRRSLSRM